MSALNLQIGSLVLPQTALNISQSYKIMNSRYDRRFADGSMVRLEVWNDKIETTIEVRGYDTLGLRELDFSNSHVIRCVAPMSVTDTTNVITITSARRGDTGTDPYGFAHNGSTWVSTPVSMNVNEATLTTVSGAIAYKVFYFPQFEAFFNEPLETSYSGVETAWSITGQQI